MVDPNYGNSSGYFRDPTNDEYFTVDTPRIVSAELKDGKFVWPMVAASDGSQLFKIVYKIFTEEEKNLYKQYRGRSPSTTVERKPKPVVVHEEPEEVDEPEAHEEPVEVVKFDAESAVGETTALTIAMCTRVLGASYINGIHYALLNDGTNRVYHVPRKCITDSEWNRLNGREI